MKEVTAYKSSDGNIYESENDCLRCELELIYGVLEASIIMRNIHQLKKLLSTERVVEKIVYRDRGYSLPTTPRNFPFTPGDFYCGEEVRAEINPVAGGLPVINPIGGSGIATEALPEGWGTLRTDCKGVEKV